MDVCMHACLNLWLPEGSYSSLLPLLPRTVFVKSGLILLGGSRLLGRFISCNTSAHSTRCILCGFSLHGPCV